MSGHEKAICRINGKIDPRIELSGDDGRGDRIRTCDPLLPKQMRYQAALLPDAGAPNAQKPPAATGKAQAKRGRILEAIRFRPSICS